MWNNYPFSQRKNASKIAVGVKVGGNGKSGWEKFFKGGVGNIQGSS